MQVLIITDLHTWTDEEQKITRDLEGYDICFLLGDISVDHLNELKEIIKTPLYGLNGNHDCNNIEAARIENIHGKSITFHNITFAGIQGSVRYKKGPWNMYTQGESVEICKVLPKADIFLTHDRAYDPGCNNFVHAGMNEILEYIETNVPKLHIHGHVHRNEERFIGKTKSIAVYKAAVIDTETLQTKIIYQD
mgnify:CR=1 FL=1